MLSDIYSSFVLPDGLRIIYLPSSSPVVCCGLTINAGMRDELPSQSGLAHFTEHALFKGTRKRKAWHILNRMGSVGGELNAYTTKEETFIYSICLAEDTERAIELLLDLVFHSQFPETELNREREVVLEEIRSYEDNPSELIFDEFENILFKGNEIGRSILGDVTCLNTFTSADCQMFTKTFYHPENMIFFFYGKIPPTKIKQLTKKYLDRVGQNAKYIPRQRIRPHDSTPIQTRVNKDLHQSHIIIGSRAYSLYNDKRIGLCLLSNLLGGPGMNSRLNMSLREKRGFVYFVESGTTFYSDTGMFYIYFGCEHKLTDKCLNLTYDELKKLCNIELTSSQLHAAVKQLKGQMGIAIDHTENVALDMGKSFLHYNHYDSLQETYHKIEALTVHQLLEIANEVFNGNQLFELIFE